MVSRNFKPAFCGWQGSSFIKIETTIAFLNSITMETLFDQIDTINDKIKTPMTYRQKRDWHDLLDKRLEKLKNLVKKLTESSKRSR
jgi:flagellar hook-associated protein FlgK